MPALRRTTKQAFYAALFAAGIATPVFVLIFLLFQSSRPAPAPRPGQTISLKVESVNVVRRAQSVDLIARVRNPNPRIGVPDLTIDFILRNDAGEEIQRIPQKAYLLPGSLNYLAALEVPLTAPVSRVEVDIPSTPEFVAVPDDFALPTFNSFLRDRTTVEAGGRRLEVQKGVVVNTSTLAFDRVDVTAVGFAAGGEITGIGQTFIGEFQVGQQREFTVEWPKAVLPTERVIVLPTTNIFRADNILPTAGDPSQLR